MQEFVMQTILGEGLAAPAIYLLLTTLAITSRRAKGYIAITIVLIVKQSVLAPARVRILPLDFGALFLGKTRVRIVW